MPFGPKYTTGDVIGCLLNRTNKTIQYFKNGTSLGIAFRDVLVRIVCILASYALTGLSKLEIFVAGALRRRGFILVWG